MLFSQWLMVGFAGYALIGAAILTWAAASHDEGERFPPLSSVLIILFAWPYVLWMLGRDKGGGEE